MKINDRFFKKIIFEIDTCSPQAIDRKLENETFKLWPDPILLSEISGNIGAFLVRAILNKLKVNEHHVFRWRLEHKYWQYQILNHYAPNCMAKTFSVSQVLSENNGVKKIRELCENGFFIKSTLGDGSGRANNFDRTAELNDIIDLCQKEYDPQEKWILQKRLNLIEEFRIHTFNRDIIHGLTFIIEGSSFSNSISAEMFVKGVLEKMPDTILQGTLVGWDIGITNTCEYYVIEANITGFHPEFNRGFQTSGYFGEPDYSSIMCAWLNNYFRSKHHISIGSIEDDLFSSDPFYKEFMFYSSILKSEHFEILKNKTKDTQLSAILYLADSIAPLLVKLVSYMQIANFVKRYYLVVSEKKYPGIERFFIGNDRVKVLAENMLFTPDEYLLVSQLGDERRKQMCFSHAARIIKEELYFTI
ncbi:hypothetical protein SAMN05421820_103370 [Pedobacter steynii]|uniref:ATP-grasp domain-containing protein n=1 Tax=Pedobacter steynii TaxID=430522 RepID=A0A1G9RX53_9SPHI|nr:hypothetical protein [Pedobacter steynii]NQX37635.1 hypothetical protein [Pedobacter steynii]SDM27065.1 hypothetical protein SAMN05421820_103370 [Pedobacter steynii]